REHRPCRRAAARSTTAMARKTVLYVNIDQLGAQHLSEHEGNKNGVQAALDDWKSGFTVVATDIYTLQSLRSRGGMSVEEVFTDKSIFAIVSAGSFTEWEVARTDAEWAKALRAYQDLLIVGPTPIFAVCGSHQLVAAAFNDWGALSHMNTPR